MLKGILIVQEMIVSIDLRRTLSRYYNIVHCYNGIDNVPESIPDAHFAVIDIYPYSESEMKPLIDKLKNNGIKIFSIGSEYGADAKYNGELIELDKPYRTEELVNAIKALQKESV